MRRRTVFAAMVWSIFVFGLVGCNNPSGAGGDRIGGKDPVVTQLPQVQVKLPPPPSFKKDHAPAKYPDGSHSVYGLRKNLKEMLEKEVKVKGFIVEVYECPPCPKGSKCPDCKKPHFWVGDKATTPKDKALMVTDYPKEDEKTKKKTTFEPKTLYFVSGTFTRRSGTGFAAADGLIRFAGAELVAQAE